MTRGRLEHYRNGQQIGLLACMGYGNQLGTAEDGVDGCTSMPYHFDYQRSIDITDSTRRVELQPGDELRTVCEYDSTERAQPTRAGYGSAEEMCQVYLYASPGERVAQNFVFTEFPVMTVDGDRGVTETAAWLH